MARRYTKKTSRRSYSKRAPARRVRRVVSRGRSGVRQQTIRIELVQPRGSLPADPSMIGLKQAPALRRSRF